MKALLIKGLYSFQSFGLRKSHEKKAFLNVKHCERALQAVTQQSVGKSIEHLRELQNA